MYRSILIAASIGLAVSGCASTYGHRAAPRPVYVQPVPAPVVTAGVSITLSANQAALVRGYVTSNSYSGNGRGRGRGHHGDLPPGIERNLQRGKPLPPGIAKAYLPRRVVAELPRLPSGLDYVIVAGKLLLVEAATAAIHDVLLDVAFDR